MTQILPGHRRFAVGTFSVLALGRAEAAPIEGEMGSTAAALFILLGVWAVFMGLRNLHELRYKSLIPERDQQDGNLRERID